MARRPAPRPGRGGTAAGRGHRDARLRRGLSGDRRKRPPVERRVERIGTESHHRSRALQFVSLALVRGALSLAVAGLMTEAFAHPIERVSAALD